MPALPAYCLPGLLERNNARSENDNYRQREAGRMPALPGCAPRARLLVGEPPILRLQLLSRRRARKNQNAMLEGC